MLSIPLAILTLLFLEERTFDLFIFLVLLESFSRLVVFSIMLILGMFAENWWV